jgi:octaprenyl-diphosphate synthase
MDAAKARDLVAEDMKAVDQLILDRLHSDVALINQVGNYIIAGGGKRLRPLLVLLAAKAMGYQGERHVDIAAIVEFIHTATLLHDDVVDESDQRRNRDTANAVWGNAASVLVGDFLYSRAFEMMVDVQAMPVMDVMSRATNRIAEGEVLQLLNCNDPDTTEEKYLEVIKRKTATLFEAGTRLAGIIAGASEEEERALAEFGLQLGIAFQIVDDALDYTGKEIGKNLGDDLEEGKPTLPLIRAIQTSPPDVAEQLRQAVTEGGREYIELVRSAIESSDAIEYTSRLAREAVDAAKSALEQLPPSRYREALAGLADFSVERDN